jgi:hypothetical protein
VPDTGRLGPSALVGRDADLDLLTGLLDAAAAFKLSYWRVDQAHAPLNLGYILAEPGRAEEAITESARPPDAEQDGIAAHV